MNLPIYDDLWKRFAQVGQRYTYLSSSNASDFRKSNPYEVVAVKDDVVYSRSLAPDYIDWTTKHPSPTFRMDFVDGDYYKINALVIDMNTFAHTGISEVQVFTLL